MGGSRAKASRDRLTVRLETCRNCGKAFAPARQNHSYCSRRCKSAAAMRRHRGAEKAVEPREGITATPAKEEGITAPPFTNNFTETLMGDDYPLEYYPDGYPKLPDCLRRKKERFGDETELGKAA